MVECPDFPAEELAAVEARLGRPRTMAWQGEVGPEELALVRSSTRRGRHHDLTFFAFDPAGRVAAIRKPSFPPGVYRAPSGGARPGERAAELRYRPIRDYAAIGDCHGGALVGRDGAIDWCALRRFDAEPVFCRLLDADRGGFWSIRPSGEHRVRRSYLDGTNILRTVFATADGEVALTDFMPLGRQLAAGLHDDDVADAEAVVGGRRAGHGLAVALGPAALLDLDRGARAVEHVPEQRGVLQLAAGLDVPVGVVRVLIGDLLDAGHVRISRPVPPAELPDESILREVINGLRAL